MVNLVFIEIYTKFRKFTIKLILKLVVNNGLRMLIYISKFVMKIQIVCNIFFVEFKFNYNSIER